MANRILTNLPKTRFFGSLHAGDGRFPNPIKALITEFAICGARLDPIRRPSNRLPTVPSTASMIPETD